MSKEDKLIEEMIKQFNLKELVCGILNRGSKKFWTNDKKKKV